MEWNHFTNPWKNTGKNEVIPVRIEQKELGACTVIRLGER